MVGSFDDYFMCAHSVHHIEDPDAVPIQISFDHQGGKFVRYDSNRPPRATATGSPWPIGHDLGRGCFFVSLTERAGTISRWVFRVFIVAGPFPPLGRDDNPSAHHGIFS